MIDLVIGIFYLMFLLGFGLVFLRDGKKTLAVLLLILFTVSTLWLAIFTNLFKTSGLHLSKDSREQFENQIREITSEEIVNVLQYTFTKQGILDVQIGDTLYLVGYEEFKGLPTVTYITNIGDNNYHGENNEGEKKSTDEGVLYKKGA